MTMTYAVGSRHDLLIGRQGKLLLVTGAEQVKQRIIVSLLHCWGSIFEHAGGCSLERDYSGGQGHQNHPVYSP
jgi:hypothetical protein